ncbi:cytochrome P450 [[Mycobacterium] burgundiense]|uniref:Cytochrome P450 n=1 Tax=[Mycobacterium] burgundiense TaxID=3064286 RepID=A0ABM9LKA5_9MYCO|nr:cytochrome P450 [Mycolicibacterium sp. MU0053]CAJ1500418.1 cytochrome P450 [Mycolicibacterium sp. MU0053]
MTNVAESLIADAMRFLTDPVFRENPGPFYERLLDGNRLLALGNGMWLIAGHAEVRSVLRDTRFSRAARADQEMEYLNADPRPEVQQMAACQAAMMLFTDPPEHTRIRRLYRDPFMPRAVVRWAAYVDELADELAQSLPRDREFDLKKAYALPIPERAICRILGVPAEDHKKWEHWTDAIVNMDRTGHGGGSGTTEAGDAMRSFGDYFAELIQQRRRNPADDLISELVTTDDHGDRLSDEELIGNLILLIMAGHETTANSIATTVVQLMAHREQWDRLVADDSLVGNAVEEILRVDGAQRFMVPRVAVEDVQIGDHHISAGDQVICVLHAANRDPKVFDNPHELDISRDSSAHLAFAPGTHLCLGMHLARMELIAGLKALIRHHPALRLAVPVHELQHAPSPTIRGWRTLPCISPNP